MQQQNSQETFLNTLKIDLSNPIHPMQQALKIALYAEYKARCFYVKAAQWLQPFYGAGFPPVAPQDMGIMLPFAAVAEAEANHVNEILYLFSKYNIAPVRDDWYAKIHLEPSFLENCEIGIVIEIEKMKMYTELIPYAAGADVLDTFYRLQAASHNIIIPALRQCVSSYYQQIQRSNATESKASPGFQLPLQELLNEYLKNILGDYQKNPLIKNLFQNLGKEFAFGSAAGAAIIRLLNHGNLKDFFGFNKKGD